MTLQRREFSGDSGPTLLITGAVHGDEFEPMEAIRRLITHLECNRLWKGTVQLIPVVNEAAYRRGHRVAEDNLDLARVCPGDPDGSITLQVAHAVSELIRQADYYIDLHTGGTELSVLPLTGYQLVPDKSVLETQRRMAHAFNLPFVWGTSAQSDGRTLSVARDAGTPAIYAEYLGSATQHQAGIEAYVDGCLNVMSEIGMIGREKPKTLVQRVVEDSRPDSGHMQICNPSPIDGYFQTTIKLGETVRQGQLLGTVCDVLGDDVREIHAETDGIVIVLRTFPRVRAGETVGVVVDVNV